MYKNQKGLSPIWLTLAVLIIASAAFVIWRIQGSKNSSHDHAESTSKKVAQSPQSTHREVAEAKKENYLEIEEWQVKFLLDETAKDVTYRFEDPSYQWFYVSTPRLDELAGQSPLCKDAEESITVNRAKPGDLRFGTPWKEEELQKIGTKFDEYHYFSEDGQPCFGDSGDLRKIDTLLKEIESIRASLSKLPKTVTAASD